MTPLAADVCFHGHIINGLFRALPEIELIRVQDIGFDDVDDPQVLAWAAQHERVLLSRDRQTMIDFAHQRIARGQPMSGLVIAPASIKIRRAVDDIILIATCSLDGEWRDRIEFLPLR